MTSYTPDQAYAQIKALEALGNLQIHPLGIQTVVIGSFDASTSRFTWAVPTVSLSIIESEPAPPRGPIMKPITLHVTAGEVVYSADTLMLQVTILNSKAPVTLAFNGSTVTAAAGQASIAVASGGWVSPESNGADSYLDAVLTSGTAKVMLPLQIFSLPRLGAGALTLPAVPVALVYAPPPGSENKNYAAYTDLTSMGQKVSSSVVSGTSVKTSTAYTIADFTTKIGAAVAELSNLAASVPALKTALSVVSAAVSDVGNILDDTTTSTSNTVTTTSDHSIQTTVAWSEAYQTPPGVGPGLGDRFVYIRNVRIAWLIIDGQLSFHVLDCDGIRDFTARELITDASAMATSGGPVVGPVTDLDAPTIASLLALDPFVGGHANPLMPAPRYEQNDPKSVGGGDTGTLGDAYTVSHDITVVDTQTHNTFWTTVTDFKPGWLKALFGNNTATENQLSFTVQSSVTTTVESTQTVTVYFFTAAGEPPYLVGLYYDTLFNTLAFVPWASGESLPPTGPGTKI